MLCADKYWRGFCARGKYCPFAHRQDELKDRAPVKYNMRPANDELRPIHIHSGATKVFGAVSA